MPLHCTIFSGGARWCNAKQYCTLQNFFVAGITDMSASHPLPTSDASREKSASEAIAETAKR